MVLLTFQLNRCPASSLVPPRCHPQSSCSMSGRMSLAFSNSYKNKRPFCVQVVVILT
nr:MAG TPA: hypothetical protein [Caudoviricetes sp.]